MKTKTSRCQFQLKIMYGHAYYIERVAKLEAAIRREPRRLQINMIGTGEVPPDWALLIRSVLLNRSPRTRIVTNARSSLQNGSVLVWLLGDQRIIRSDARIYFRPTTLSDEEQKEQDGTWKDSEPKYRDSYSEIDPDECDYARVLQRINEFLPVKELAGRIVAVPVLRQFGLVESDKMDDLLTAAFGKRERPKSTASLVPG
jgi:hypothetical protein